MSRFRLLIVLLTSLLLPLLFNPVLGTATYLSPYTPDRTTFSIFLNDQALSSSIGSLFILPGAPIDVRPPVADSYALKKDGEPMTQTDGRWTWSAPEKPGLSVVTLTNTQTNETMTVNIFVMVPASEVEHGFLHGFHIGSYPRKPLKNLPMYVPPEGFVEVTPENRFVRVSPHFRLSQFLCKQSPSSSVHQAQDKSIGAGNYPQYVVLQRRLLDKLEALLARANEEGFTCETFSVMSGFRTPFYNRAIGNVAYSRHQWGDAADIFIDQNPPDGVMDDLNGDGKIDKEDSLLLARLAQNLDAEEQELQGGVGSYKSTRSHGPFVHVDARGISKTW